jgi:hypothetical protein
MTSLTDLRQNPHFARFFEAVHPLFWPVVWWTLNAVFREYDASNRTEFLLGITWWGQVHVVYRGDLRADPRAYKPIPRTFRELSDPSWETSLPANLDSADLSALHALVLPCEAGAFRDQKSHGDFPGKESGTLFPNTS